MNKYEVFDSHIIDNNFPLVSNQYCPPDICLLPIISTRAPQPYSDDDYLLIIEALGENLAQRVFYRNAINLYRPKKLT